MGVQTLATGEVFETAKGTTEKFAATNSRSVGVTSKKKNHVTRKKKKKHTTDIGIAPVVNGTKSTGANITTESGADLTEQASDYRAPNGVITLRSKQGRINLLHALMMRLHRTSKSSEDMAWKSESNYFALHEDVKILHLEGGKGVRFETPEGITVELGIKKFSHLDGSKNKGKPLKSEQLRDCTGEAGYDWLPQLLERDDVLRVYVDERHETGRVATQGLTAAAKIVVAIAVTLATGGSGGGICTGLGNAVAGGLQLSGTMAAIVSGAVSATASAVINQTVVSTIDHRGHMGAVADELTSKDSMKNFGVTAITGGATGGLKLPSPNGFVQQIQSNAVRASISVGAKIAMGYKPKDAIRSAGVSFVAGVFSGTIANKIGQWRAESLNGVDENGLKINDTPENYLAHKMFHAFLGAASGAGTAAMMGEDRDEILKAAAGAAAGACVAEVMAESMKDDLRQRAKERMEEESKGVAPEELADLADKISREELARVSNLTQLAAASTALLSKMDVAAASEGARNAIENNAVFLLAPVILEGIELAAVAYRGYRLYRAAETVVKVVNAASEAESSSRMDAAPEGAEWTDDGVQTEQGKVQVHSTPLADQLPALEGYESPYLDALVRDQGFGLYDGVDTSILTNDGAKVRREMGEYRDVKGHHVHAKKAFEGHPNYDLRSGFSISNEFMARHDIDHNVITGAQKRLFTELAKSGRVNSLEEHTRIAVQSLIDGNCSPQLARDIVSESLKNLRSNGVRNPTNIPWNNAK